MFLAPAARILDISDQAVFARIKVLLSAADFPPDLPQILLLPHKRMVRSAVH